MHQIHKLVLMATVATLASAASATDLTFQGSVDNTFTASISTDDSVAGTTFATGDNWGVTYSGTTSLTPNVTNYLHIAGVDLGPPASLIASLSLSDTGFEFANGTQSLDTNTTDWAASSTGFGQAPTALSDLGLNGASPWGTRTNVSAAAHYIWPTSGSSTAFFSVAIMPVPEPGTLAVIAFGLTVVARRRQRR